MITNSVSPSVETRKELYRYLLSVSAQFEAVRHLAYTEEERDDVDREINGLIESAHEALLRRFGDCYVALPLIHTSSGSPMSWSLYWEIQRPIEDGLQDDAGREDTRKTMEPIYFCGPSPGPPYYCDLQWALDLIEGLNIGRAARNAMVI